MTLQYIYIFFYDKNSFIEISFVRALSGPAGAKKVGTELKYGQAFGTGVYGLSTESLETSGKVLQGKCSSLKHLLSSKCREPLCKAWVFRNKGWKQALGRLPSRGVPCAWRAIRMLGALSTPAPFLIPFF